MSLPTEAMADAKVHPCRGRLFWLRVRGGFVLGVLRTVLVVADVGETVAVALDHSSISWIASRWLINRLEVPSRFVSRVVMGTVAFVLLMAGIVYLPAACRTQRQMRSRPGGTSGMK